MGKCAIELRGKNKMWIYFLNELAPALGDFGLDVSVERRVDLDRVEIFGIELQVWLLQLGRVELTVPILVLPSGGADVSVWHLVLLTLRKRYLSGFHLGRIHARRQLEMRSHPYVGVFRGQIFIYKIF